MASRVTIPVELHHDALALYPGAAKVGHDLALLWYLDRVRTGHVSTGRVAEMLQQPVASVIDLLHAHGIPHPTYSVDDLRREVWFAG
jgi:predicted HTH domain antitoxin